MPGSIEAQQLKKIIKSSKPYLLLDVREVEEFEQGHIKSAILMPWHTIDKKITGIKKDKEIIVYCTVNPRALRAAKSLEDLGYKNVSILKYGYEGWELEELIKK